MRKNGWNQSEIDFLVNNAGTLTDHEIAEQLSQMTGRKITRTACTQRRARLGLKKLRGRKGKTGAQRFDTSSVTAPKVEPASLPNPVVEQQESTVQHDHF